MNALFGQLGSAGELERALSTPRVCLRCDTVYTERDNVGRWLCTEFHPLGNYTTVHDRVYPCCRLPVPSRGCVRADHTDQIMYDCEPKMVDRAVLALLDKQMIVGQSWQLLNNGNYLVHRVDQRAYEDACSATGSTANYNPLVLRSSIKTRIF